RKKQRTVVAVGGAINTILLRSRASTADVNFFSLDTANNPVLRDGIKSAAKTMQLGEGWMNNHTALSFLPTLKPTSTTKQLAMVQSYLMSLGFRCSLRPGCTV
ncbi:hypothetical protein C8R48DRAFT_793684, partial [Suillus tomentosus]